GDEPPAQRGCRQAATSKPVGSIALLGGGNVDDRAGRRRRRYRLTVLLQAFNVELDRLEDQTEHLVTCLGRRHAARQIRNIRSERGGTLFDHDQVAHLLSPTS